VQRATGPSMPSSSGGVRNTSAKPCARHRAAGWRPKSGGSPPVGPRVPLHERRPPGRVATLPEPCGVRRPWRRQHRANRLDPTDVSVLVDERHRDSAPRRAVERRRRKKLRRFAQDLGVRHNWRCSRSRSFNRRRSSVAGATPWRPPPSARRTHLRRVSAVQPSFAAMAQVVAHSDGCSPRASRSRRTARSRTSGENFRFVSLRTPVFSTLGVSGKTGAVHGPSARNGRPDRRAR
jgi:hypothetical protein